jgi:hypothetical protein
LNNLDNANRGLKSDLLKAQKPIHIKVPKSAVNLKIICDIPEAGSVEWEEKQDSIMNVNIIPFADNRCFIQTHKEIKPGRIEFAGIVDGLTRKFVFEVMNED